MLDNIKQFIEGVGIDEEAEFNVLVYAGNAMYQMERGELKPELFDIEKRIFLTIQRGDFSQEWQNVYWEAIMAKLENNRKTGWFVTQAEFVDKYGNEPHCKETINSEKTCDPLIALEWAMAVAYNAALRHDFALKVKKLGITIH